MKTLYTLALTLLIGTPAFAQSHSNPVGEQAMESEIRKNERWATFYDSLTPAERKDFIHWWDTQVKSRPAPATPQPNAVGQYKREFREGLRQWYSHEVPQFEQKREMETRYNQLWQQRQAHKLAPDQTPAPRKKTVIRVMDRKDAPPEGSLKSRYYTR